VTPRRHRPGSPLHARARLAALLLVAACASTSGPDGTGFPLGAASVELEIDYCEGDPAQRLDLHFPSRRIATPTPVVLHVHGGGWARGDKASGPWFTRVGEALIARGYVVASANYRLAPTHTWPDQITDVVCAVRYLRQNAARHGIDPGRIGVWGNSAGGHLVALLGVTDSFSGPGVSSRPQAVVSLYGIHDLTAADTPLLTALAIEVAFGSRPDPASPVLRGASPISHVSAGDAPIFLIHGNRDLVVLPNQSQAMSDRLQQGGVPSELLVVENAGHELVPSGGAIEPSEAEITRRIVDFFDDRLLGP
jgi:acetyl esterase/lipase